MKLLQELLSLNETVTFGAVKLKDEDGKRVWDYTPFEKKVEIDCRDCEDNDDGKPFANCHFCKGTGKEHIWQNVGPTLNMANVNAHAVITALGFKSDSEDGTVGVWEPKELPNVRRTLIKLKNGGIDSLTTDDEKHVGSMRAMKDEDGQDRIGRGATVYHFGRTHSQVERYIDDLLKLIDFAQKNDAAVAWS